MGTDFVAFIFLKVALNSMFHRLGCETLENAGFEKMTVPKSPSPWHYYELFVNLSVTA